jgi:benzylsuccinate CoA-transferase BbsE subunit
MQQTTTTPAALDGIRVLDLTTELGQYASKLLADMGADVIRIEPPAGSPARLAPPFYHDEPTDDRSLPFWYFNTSKRSVTLDIATADGQSLFRRLLATADVLIESFQPSQAAALLPSDEERQRINPRLIHCSVTGFGTWGPHADYLATDLVGVAMSGILTLAGYPDRAPTMPPVQQGYLSAGVQAAQGILAAILQRDIDTPGRERTTRGQRVEVSMQEALSMSQETAMQYWDIRREVRKRAGETKSLPGYGTFACKDGHVFLMVSIGGAGAHLPELIDWMADEGMAADLTEPYWQEVIQVSDARLLGQLLNQPEQLREKLQQWAHINDVIGAFLMTRTKQELYEEGQRARFLIGPANSAKDLMENPHLNARSWYQQVEHPELDTTITYPGPPFRHSETPWRISRRPPLLGEHTAEVLRADLGLTDEEITTLGGAGVV